jgi:hypothetical protein
MFVFKRHLDYRQRRRDTGCYQGISSSEWLQRKYKPEEGTHTAIKVRY